jgi:NADH-quinone oxidoreductase subunit L
VDEAAMLTLSLAVLGAPLVGFVLQYVLGRRLPRQGDWLTVLAMGVSLVCSVLLARAILAEGAGARHVLGPWTWLDPGGGVHWNVGIALDGLTAVMLVVVSLVAFLVHVFSMGYMKGDPKYPLFFAWLQMFSFSMLVLVLADNLLHLFMGWELVGLCSYKLIGFWSEKAAPANAARKAFITTRIGDLGMLLAICVIGGACASFAFDDIFAAVAAGTFDGPWLTVAGLGIVLAAVGKSAQLPLHVWLPDAMEGPTPVSALIHAATMVAAGVYLVGRMMPMLAPEVLIVVAVIGAVTALMAGLIALCQNDIKRVLAYSTCSQLGYMFLGLGVGAWHAALFHLTTHAFFKALMFLGSGSVIHGCHHEQDMRRMGGLLRRMPVTSWTFAVGVLAIAGVPFLSGFYSKDGILSGAWNRFPLLFWIGLGAALLTAFYMTRLFVMTFLGRARSEHAGRAHESPVSMTLPLIVLGVLAVVAGYPLLDWHETLLAPPADQGLLARAGTLPPLDSHFEHVGTVVSLAIGAGLLGLVLGFVVFGLRASSVPALKMPFRALETAFANRFWFDEFYRLVVLRPAYRLAVWCRVADAWGIDGVVNAVGRGGLRTADSSGAHDRQVVDGLVRFVGALFQVLGAGVSLLQSGRVRLYLSLSVGAIAVALVLERIL